VDDLTFSGESARSVINSAVKILRYHGFHVSHAKLRIMGPSDRHEITGIVANEGLGVPRENRAKIRAAIHQLKTLDAADREKEIVSINGRIGFVKQINDRSAARLEKQFQKITDVSG
jgi:hypothetical protein